MDMIHRFGSTQIKEVELKLKFKENLKETEVGLKEFQKKSKPNKKEETYGLQLLTSMLTVLVVQSFK